MIEKIGSISFSNVKHPGINEHPQRVSFAGEADKVELSTTAKEENKSSVNKNWLYALGALAIAVGGYFIFRGSNGDDLAKAGKNAAGDLKPKPKSEPNIETKTPKTEPKPSSEPAPAAENLKAESKPATETKPPQEASKTEPIALENVAKTNNGVIIDTTRPVIYTDEDCNKIAQAIFEYNTNGEKVTYIEKFGGSVSKTFYDNGAITKRIIEHNNGISDELTRIYDNLYEGVRTYPDGKKVKIREENLKTIELGPVEE